MRKMITKIKKKSFAKFVKIMLSEETERDSRSVISCRQTAVYSRSIVFSLIMLSVIYRNCKRAFIKQNSSFVC